MKHYSKKVYETDVSIWTFHPSEGIPVLMQQKNRQYIDKFHNKYYEDMGFMLVEISNCSLFSYVDKKGNKTNKSIPYGTTMRDKGHWINKPYINDWLVTMIYQNDKFIIDDFTNIDKYPDALIMFGGYPCILGGKKDSRKWDKTAHLFSSTSRTIIGQKSDATIIKIVTKNGKGLTADQCAELCISLEIVNAVILDSGESSQQIINGNHVNSNRRRVANGLGTYAKKGYNIVYQDDTVDLIIDPGHGGRDLGGGSNKYWIEKDRVLDISLYQYKRFKELGIKVALTRESDITLVSTDRIKKIVDSGAKYCISNHINAGGGDGAETIHSIYSKGQMAYEIAECIKKDGQNIRRVFTRTYPSNNKLDYYYLHRETGAVETTIVEYGFADSKKDDVEQILNYWKYYAEAVIEGYCKVVGVKYTPNEYTLIPKENDELEILQQENIMLKDKVKDFEDTIQEIKDLANRML